FNTSFFAETRLDAQVFQTTALRLGIADYRGDGRSDYLYSARVLYGDNVSPARANVAGGTPLTIAGLGLQSSLLVQTAGVTQLDLSLLNPSVWIAQGATLRVPLSARAISNGTPIIGRTVTYQITQGAASLSSATAQTDIGGNASVNLQINS